MARICKKESDGKARTGVKRKRGKLRRIEKHIVFVNEGRKCRESSAKSHCKKYLHILRDIGARSMAPYISPIMKHPATFTANVPHGNNAAPDSD